jgi:hypothetical protein
MTIYSKEMKTTRIDVEDTIKKQRRMYSHERGLQREIRRKRSKKRMDERDIEEEGKNREGKGWGI